MLLHRHRPVCFALFAAPLGAQSPPPPPAPVSTIIAAPLAFEGCGGGVGVVARAPGYTCWIHDRGASFRAADGDELRWSLEGARAVPPRLVGDRCGSTHVFVGDEPDAWRVGIERWTQALQERVLPGIDLRWHGDPTRVEYDFEVAPGADPDQLRIHLEGVEGLAVDAAGRLEVTRRGRTWHQPAPRAWTEDGTPVEVTYRRIDGSRFGFALGAWDRAQALTIDPVVAYSTYIGGTGADQIRCIARDAQGNLYVGGRSASLDFPGTVGSPLGAHAGLWDLVVAKLDPTASQVLWATYLGGTDAYGEDEYLSWLDVDAQGRVAILGRTEASDFPTVAPWQAQRAGGVEATLSMLDASGGTLLWSTYLGGSGNDLDDDRSGGGSGYVRFGPQGDLWVAGATWSGDFPVTANAAQSARSGPNDLFLGRFGSNGQPQWLTYLGFDGDERISDLEWSPQGYLVLGGSTLSSNWPVPPQAYAAEGPGLIAAIDPNTQQLLWSTRFPVAPSGIDVDAAGDVHLVGTTSGGSVPVTLGAHQVEHGGSHRSFVWQAWACKLSVLGTTLAYGTYFGSSSANESFSDVEVDAFNHPVCIGSRGSGSSSTVYRGLVVKFDPDATETIYVQPVGGSGSGVAALLEAGPGAVWVAGTSWDAAAAATPGAMQGRNNGGEDGFVARIEDPASRVLSVRPLGTYVVGGRTSALVIALDGVAAAGGAVVALSSSLPAALQVPASVVVPAGAASVRVAVTAGLPANDQIVSVQAQGLGSSAAAVLTVGPGPRYRIVGNPDPGSETEALDVNAYGVMVGRGSRGAFRYQDGQPVRYLAPGSAEATAISDTGVIAGRTAFYGTAFRWTPTAGLQSLGTLSGMGSSWAHGVNDAGQVVGGGDMALPGGFSGQGAFRGTPGAPLQVLPNLGGGIAEAFGINRSGQVAGMSHTTGGTIRALRYTDGVGSLDLGVLAGFSYSVAAAVNDLGAVVGRCFSSVNSSTPFLWEDGVGMTDLGAPAGLPGGGATDVNHFGQVVGWAGGLSSSTATLYDGAAWTVLQDQLSADDRFAWTLDRARAINDRGEIVGGGYYRGNGNALTAFKLVPTFFEPYGNGCPGSGGVVTALQGSGAPVRGAPVTLRLRGAPNALALVATSLAPASTPLPGGCTLLIGAQIGDFGLQALDARGVLELNFAVPASIQPQDFYLQAATLDAGSANGAFTVSNGIKLVVPY